MSSSCRSINGHVPENIRLFIGGIPLNKTKEEVATELLRMGMPGIRNVIMYKNNCAIRKNRGYVFVEYADHITAAVVLDCFKNVLRLFDKQMYMDWANPATKVQTGVMDEVKILFIRGITTMMNKEEFIIILSNIVKNTTYEKVFKDQGHAFVHFFTRKAAGQAMLSLESALMSSKYLHLQWEVSWAIPQEKIVVRTNNTSCPLCEERRWVNIVKSVVLAGLSSF